MYEEIMKYVGDRDPTYEDLKNLTFVDMFIKEGKYYNYYYYLIFLFSLFY